MIIIVQLYILIVALSEVDYSSFVNFLTRPPLIALLCIWGELNYLLRSNWLRLWSVFMTACFIVRRWLRCICQEYACMVAHLYLQLVVVFLWIVRRTQIAYMCIVRQSVVFLSNFYCFLPTAAFKALAWTKVCTENGIRDLRLVILSKAYHTFHYVLSQPKAHVPRKPCALLHHTLYSAAGAA